MKYALGQFPCKPNPAICPDCPISGDCVDEPKSTYQTFREWIYPEEYREITARRVLKIAGVAL